MICVNVTDRRVEYLIKKKKKKKRTCPSDETINAGTACTVGKPEDYNKPSCCFLIYLYFLGGEASL